MYELVIVGAGPAGMTAAVYAARKGLVPLVLSKDLGGQANWSSEVENYMGFKDIRGSELMDRFEEQMRAQRLQHETCEVVKIERRDGGFGLRRADGKEDAARAVIVATGKSARALNVPGEERLRGKGVSYCATCDGPLFRGAAVAVVGGGNAGLQACRDLLAVAREVHLITEGGITADRAVRDKVLGDPRLRVREHTVVRAVTGEQAVEGLIVAGPDGNETELAVEGVFVEIGLDPNSGLLAGLARLNAEREAEVDCRCRTGVPGLFAAGDVSTSCGKQIIVAAGEGAKAALAAADYLAYG
ncbi:MAG: NAD(P)/FAD-dependent oxidoreductase [Patescibacteria group bacterium]